MTRPATTLNTFEMEHLVKSKLSNHTLREECVNLFKHEYGNLREVTSGLLEIIQRLYAKNVELEHLISNYEKERS